MIPSAPETATLAGAVVALVGVVAFVVRWLVKQATDDDRRAEAHEADTQQRLAALEGKVEFLEKALSSERSAKHAALADRAAYLGTLRVIRHLHATLDLDQFGAAVPRLLETVPTGMVD